MKITIFLIVLFLSSCTVHEPPVKKAEDLVKHYLDSVYKPHKVAIGRFSYFKVIDSNYLNNPQASGYSLHCEYRIFKLYHGADFMINSSITKVDYNRDEIH